MASSLACADAPALPGSGQDLAGNQHVPARTERALAGLMARQCIAAGCRHRLCHRAVVAAEHPGVSRRLQALAAIGWDKGTLGRRLGVDRVSVRKAADGMLWPLPPWLINATDALYEEIWDVTGPSLETAQISRRRGKAPPMAWDDDQPGDLFYSGHGIDDPAGIPAPGWKRPPARRDEDVLAELLDLMAMGLSPNQAMIRAHVGSSRLQRLRNLMAEQPQEQPWQPQQPLAVPA
jgi:hypothetical protein